LEPGSYTVEAVSERLGRGRLEGIVVSAGREAQVQAFMAFEAVPRKPIRVAVHPPARETTIPTPAPSDPLRELALFERKAAEFTRENPSIEAAIVNGPLTPQTLRQLDLSGRDLWRESRLTPTTASPVLISELAIEPLQTLLLSGRRAPPSLIADAQPSLVIAGPASLEYPVISEVAAASALSAALELERLSADPIHATTDQIDPVTSVVAITPTASEIQACPPQAADGRILFSIRQRPLPAQAGPPRHSCAEPASSRPKPQ
jgi:hypothetical protein